MKKVLVFIQLLIITSPILFASENDITINKDLQNNEATTEVTTTNGESAIEEVSETSSDTVVTPLEQYKEAEPSGEYAGGKVVLWNVQDAVELALQSSEKLKIEEQLALLEMKTAKLSIKDFLPTLSFSYSDSDMIQMNSSDTRTKNLEFDFSVPVFNGGKTKMAYDMAKMSANYKYKDFEVAKRKFQSLVVSSYYEYIMARSAADISETLLDNAEVQLAITESEYNLGLVLETDYIDYVLYVMNLRSQLKQSQREVRTLLRKFKLLLGLPLEAELVLAEETVPDMTNEFLIEPRSNFIWQIVERTNLELEQEKINMAYNRKQIKINERAYMPTVGFEGGVKFNGPSFPLSSPSVFFSLALSFDNNPLLPIKYSTKTNLKDNKVTGGSNNFDAYVVPEIEKTLSKTTNRLSASKSNNDYEEKRHNLEEDVFSKIAVHDDCYDSIIITQESLKLQERRLEISKLRVEKGEIKRLDYLKELEQYANQQIKLEKLYNQLLSSWHELELLTDLPLGELKNVCNTNEE